MTTNRQSVIVIAVGLWFSGIGWAQQPTKTPKLAIQATVGIFAEGRSEPHLVLGGSVPCYFSSQFNVAPEFLYLRASKDDPNYYLFSALAGIDFRKPPKTVRPYANSGYAFGVTHEPDGTPYRSWRFAGFRIGIKIFVTDRLYIAPEMNFFHFDGAMLTFTGGYVVSQRSN